MFLISIPAFLTVDKFGRRTIVIWGGLLLMFCMLVIGSLYASNNVIRGKGAGRWVVIVLIFVFALAYVSTWGIVGKIYASEIQPAHNRATANALAQALNFVSYADTARRERFTNEGQQYTNFLTAFITPIFLARFSSGPYFLFAALTASTRGLVALDAGDEVEVPGIDSRGLHITHSREAVDCQIPRQSRPERELIEKVDHPCEDELIVSERR